MDVTKTARGFDLIEFTDRGYDVATQIEALRDQPDLDSGCVQRDGENADYSDRRDCLHETGGETEHDAAPHCCPVCQHIGGDDGLAVAGTGGVEHVSVDNMSFGRSFIADWIAETFVELAAP